MGVEDAEMCEAILTAAAREFTEKGCLEATIANSARNAATSRSNGYV